MLIPDLSLFYLSTIIHWNELINISKIRNPLLFTELLPASYEPDSPLDARSSLLTQNEDLKIAIAVLIALSFILIVSLLFMLKKNKSLKKTTSSILNDLETDNLQESEIYPDTQNLIDALNNERARVIKYEVQKKELLAHIDELKALNGQSDLRHKTIEFQKAFSEQNSNEIIGKVEDTAKTLFPELVNELQARFNELNKFEIQYCLMLALGYSQEEITSLLGRSEKAIKSLRYRVRKKMNLEEGQNLKTFIVEMKSYLTQSQQHN